MSFKEYKFSYKEVDDVNLLPSEDASLLDQARKATQQAYAPYSKFFVGAAALLDNGQTISATNQENASFPAGLCAERVLLSAAASLYSNNKIKTIAISYDNKNGESNRPVSPCGICRQSLLEYEGRIEQPVRLLLSGLTGKIIIIESASLLLPLSFSAKDM